MLFNRQGFQQILSLRHILQTQALKNVYKVTKQGPVSIIAGEQDGLNKPMHAVANANGNVYIADQGNHQIWYLPYQDEVILFAGTGEGFTDGSALSEAHFYNPYALALDIPNNHLFVAGATNARIRMVVLIDDPAQRTVTILATTGGFGMVDGIGTEAELGKPAGLVYYPNENILYFTDWYNNSIRSVNLLTGKVTTLVAPELNVTANLTPTNSVGITIGRNGSLYFADHQNHVIRRIDHPYDGYCHVEEIAGFYGSEGNQDSTYGNSWLNHWFGIQST